MEFDVDEQVDKVLGVYASNELAMRALAKVPDRREKGKIRNYYYYVEERQVQGT